MRRPIAPIAMPDIVPGSAETSAPTCQWVKPSALLVDEAYQRNLSERSITLIRRIVAGFDWRRFKPPIVVDTGDGFEVIDGQHTAIAAASHPAVEIIPVMVVEAAEVADRARAFIGHNRDRLQITATQMHYAAVAAGDEDAITVEQVCARAGIRILRHPPGQGRFLPCDTMAVGAISAVVQRWGALRARQILQVLADALCTPIRAEAIRAVAMLMTEAENAELRERIARFERDFMGGMLVCPPDWRLTGSEQRVLGVLLTREMATKDQIMTTLYREFGRDEPEPKIVDVYVCKLRRKMSAFGLKIETVWGKSYRIAEPMRSEFLDRIRAPRFAA